MKLLIFLSLLPLTLFGADIASKDTNTTETTKLMVVEDKSGLSDDEVRSKADDGEQKKNNVSISDVTNSIDVNGNIDLSKIQDKWENLSPTPKKYDWVKTESGEWFKGEINALYENQLEFDSAEIGLYTFNFDDVVEIKSYNIISVNIENLATFPGVLRLKGKVLKVVQGEHTYEFERDDVVSFAPAGEHERNFWSGKVTVGLDLRKGNTNQYDYNAKVNIKRRTAKTRLTLDYLGRKSSKDNIETADDHRINEKYDRYLSRNFFWTPIFSEFYTDKYKNIHRQLSLGSGLGYTVINTPKIEWNISSGPGYIYTRYVTVAAGQDLEVSSLSLEASTKLEIELNDMTDLTFDYKMTLINRDSGLYKHHAILSFENKLNSWLDFDISAVWDYLAVPEADSLGVIPKKNDYQMILGFGIEF